MPALEEGAVRQNALGSRSGERGTQLRIVVLGEREHAAARLDGAAHEVDGRVASCRGVDRHKVATFGIEGCNRRGERGAVIRPADALHHGAEGATLPFEAGRPNQIVGYDDEVRRGHLTVQVSPEATTRCRSTGPLAARAAIAPSICSTRS